MSDETPRPQGVYVPDEQSLDFATRVAQTQGMAFDREATRHLGTNLYEYMFADLVRVLNLDIEPPDFHAGVFPAARAFAAKSRDGHPAVALDMVFDYWLFSLSHLISILTFTVPHDGEQERIIADIDSLFGLYLQANGFDRSRDRMAPYIVDTRYTGQLLNVSSLLARATLVYILCHEIAHIRLGHLDLPDNPEHEMEADAQAARFFLQVVEYGGRDRDTHIHVDPKLAGAPLIFSMILELFEAWMKAKGFRLDHIKGHPPAARRTAQLQHLMANDLNDTALDMVMGATQAIAGLHRLMGLPEPMVWQGQQ